MSVLRILSLSNTRDKLKGLIPKLTLQMAVSMSISTQGNNHCIFFVKESSVSCSVLFGLLYKLLDTRTQEWNLVDGAYSKGGGELISAGRGLLYLLLYIYWYFLFIVANK